MRKVIQPMQAMWAEEAAGAGYEGGAEDEGGWIRRIKGQEAWEGQKG